MLLYLFTFIFSDKNKVEVFAGTSNTGGFRDGTSQESEFNCPNGIAIDHKTNTCFITDVKNNRIRAIKYSVE